MADYKLSTANNPASPLTGTELLEVSQEVSSGVWATRVATAQDIADLASSGSGGGAAVSIFDPSKSGGALQSQKFEYYSLAGNSAVDLVNIASGSGYISSLFLAFFGTVTYWQGAIIRIYYDGETTPSVEMPFERFFICQYAAANTAMVSEFFGFNRSASDTMGMFMNLPIPYSNGIRIELVNLTANAFTLFSTAIIHSGVANTWSRTRRLMAQSVYIPAAAAYSSHTFIDVTPNGPGRIVAIWLLEDDYPGGLSPKGAALEGNIAIHLDGAVSPSYESSGTEDYFLMSFYFGGAGANRFGGEVGTTYMNATAGTFGAWRTHIRHPIEFSSGFKVTWQCGEQASVLITGGTARVWATVFYYTE